MIVDHAFPLQGRPHFAVDELGFTIGTLAVDTFFVISGFLIVKSWLDDPRVIAFVVKRVLRIMPALIVAVLATAIVVGGMATTLPLADYLRNPDVRTYIANNVRVFPLSYDLPGVFTENPYPLAVNGSLWTLPIEVVAYSVVLLIGATRLLRRRALVVGVLAFTVFMRFQLASDRWLGSGVWFHMSSVFIWELLSLFLIGSLLYLYRERVVLSGPIALALAVAYFVLKDTSLATIAFDLEVPYGILTLAFADLPWLQRLVRPGDVSYGVYIYAFPIQQLLASHRPNMNPWVSMLFTIPATYAVALLSWRLVERPALSLKRYVRRSARVAPAPASA